MILSDKAVCTSVKVSTGNPEYLSLHLHRLLFFASQLERPWNPIQTERDVHEMAFHMGNGVIRIELDVAGNITLTPRSLPPANRLRALNYIDGRSPLETRFKWLERSVWDAVKKQSSMDVLVLLDSKYRYLECCIGNLFVYRPSCDQWYTPAVDLPFLPGVMRSVVLSHTASLGVSILEEYITAEAEDELWMCNALRGFVALNDANRSVPTWIASLSQESESLAFSHFSATLKALSC